MLLVRPILLAPVRNGSAHHPAPRWCPPALNEVVGRQTEGREIPGLSCEFGSPYALALAANGEGGEQCQCDKTSASGKHRR